MTIISTMPRLKIQKIMRIYRLPIIDEFRTTTIDEKILYMTVHEDPAGVKYFVLGTRITGVGWTSDHVQAFRFFKNAGIFTYRELQNIARGTYVDLSEPIEPTLSLDELEVLATHSAAWKPGSGLYA